MDDDEYKNLTQEGYFMNVVKNTLNNCDLMRDISGGSKTDLIALVDELEKTSNHVLAELQKYPKYKNN